MKRLIPTFIFLLYCLISKASNDLDRNGILSYTEQTLVNLHANYTYVDSSTYQLSKAELKSYINNLNSEFTVVQRNIYVESVLNLKPSEFSGIFPKVDFFIVVKLDSVTTTYLAVLLDAEFQLIGLYRDFKCNIPHLGKALELMNAITKVVEMLPEYVPKDNFMIQLFVPANLEFSEKHAFIVVKQDQRKYTLESYSKIKSYQLNTINSTNLLKKRELKKELNKELIQIKAQTGFSTTD